jgi:hypothetical protein
MKISGQDFSEEIIRKTQQIFDMNPKMSITRLSRLVCRWLNWQSENGKLKEMSCRVALRKLERKGFLRLPESKGRVGRKTNATGVLPSLTILPFEGKLNELGKVEVVKVTGREKELSRLWRDLMDTYHYLGSGPLCGAQIRYLIKSERQGYLGGLSFSASAWRLGPRDEWIGWSDKEREKNLRLVIGNSRFLIAPAIKVKNLASHVLGLCIKQVPLDWVKQYDYAPLLLETFVDSTRFKGTSYRAANWILVGKTSGRGRQDSMHKRGVAVKDIYIYPLRRDSQERLRGADQISASVEEEKRICEDWAEEEFGTVDLGDKRLQTRLLSISRDLYARPQANIPQACGSRAKTKAAYRFFKNENTTMERILQGHYRATEERVRKEKIVLAIQDTTSFNYSSHPMTDGLGPIGSKVEGGPIGLIMHDTMAFTTKGTPLGLIDVQCWSRDEEEFGKKHKRRMLPIEEKESNKWLISYRKATEVQKACPDVMVVSVGDREADIYDLFHLAISEKSNPKLLVRATQDRTLMDGVNLWSALLQRGVSGIQEVRVPRRPGKKERIARLCVKYSPVTLKPPQRKRKLPEVNIWAVFVKEEEVPEGEEGLEWMLLINMPVSSFNDAVEKMEWYSKRWGIEVFHRTLKSGCKIEERQLGSADSIESCLAIDLVVAWRIYHLAKLGRETPDCPCSVYFAEEEWKALNAFITKDPKPPEKPPILRDAILMVSSLGGFLGRKSDGEPGTKSLWLGLQRLDDITATWKVMVSILSKYIPVSSMTGYG